MASQSIASSHQDEPKKSRKKRRRISKHVLQAQEEQRKQQQKGRVEGETTIPAPPSQSKVALSLKTKKSKKNVVKDPNEAASYLTQWKNHQQGSESDWKFNKNTQSWLIRHMYEAEKVPKSTFTLLLEYLQGLQGGDAKSRIRTEATRRALRYKEYEKSRAENPKEESAEDPKEGSEAEDEQKTEEDSKKEDSNSSPSAADDEEARWEKLNDHEKRKEYKRARKVLEELKET